MKLPRTRGNRHLDVLSLIAVRRLSRVPNVPITSPKGVLLLNAQRVPQATSRHDLPAAVMTYVYIVFALACLLSLVAGSYNEGGLAKHCRLTVEGQAFDLCPIFDAREAEDGWTLERVKQTPPTITTTQYKFGLDKPLKKDGTLPAHEQVCSRLSNGSAP